MDIETWLKDAERDGVEAEGLAEYVKAHPDHVCYCDGCGLPAVFGRVAELFPSIDPGAEITLTRDGENYCDSCRWDSVDSMNDYGPEDEAAEYDGYGHGCGNYEFDW